MKSSSKILTKKDLAVKSNYQTIASEKYGANIEMVDFSAPVEVAKQINSWVKSETQGLIPELLDPGKYLYNTLIWLTCRTV